MKWAFIPKVLQPGDEKVATDPARGEQLALLIPIQIGDPQADGPLTSADLSQGQLRSREDGYLVPVPTDPPPFRSATKNRRRNGKTTPWESSR